MSTYNLCKKLIDTKKRTLGVMSPEYAEWKTEMAEKLNVFLLANRIENTQYRELMTLLDSEE